MAGLDLHPDAMACLINFYNEGEEERRRTPGGVIRRPIRWASTESRYEDCLHLQLKDSHGSKRQFLHLRVAGPFHHYNALHQLFEALSMGSNYWNMEEPSFEKHYEDQSKLCDYLNTNTNGMHVLTQWPERVNAQMFTPLDLQASAFIQNGENPNNFAKEIARLGWKWSLYTWHPEGSNHLALDVNAS